MGGQISLKFLYDFLCLFKSCQIKIGHIVSFNNRSIELFIARLESFTEADTKDNKLNDIRKYIDIIQKDRENKKKQIILKIGQIRLCASF